MAELLGETGKHAIQRNRGEPWRQFVGLMLARLPDVGRQPPRPPIALPARANWLADLDAAAHLCSRERACRAPGRSLAIEPVERAVELFGFHLGVLDIRQNSAVHEKAISQLVRAAGIDAQEIAEWTEKDRLVLLDHELRSPRPLAHAQAELGPRGARCVLDCYRAVAKHYRKAHGSSTGSAP
jgi:phosphoenolpyruvate carboxylase